MKRNLFGSTISGSPIVLVNNTGCDIRPYEAEMLASLRSTGKLPEELADLFVVTCGPGNEDGSPRWILNPA